MTPTEIMIPSLLMERSAGAFGSQLLDDSDGKLKRGSADPLLGRLEQARFVKLLKKPAQDGYALPRSRSQITARREFAQ